MDPIYRPIETKRIIAELHDPLLYVEYNPLSKEWEVSKLAHGIREFTVPGSLVGSEKEFVTIPYVFEYWSVQATFKHWGEHVFETMRKSRPEFQETKEICNSIQFHDDKVQEKNTATMDDCRNQTKKEISKILRPTLYSFNRKVS